MKVRFLSILLRKKQPSPWKWMIQDSDLWASSVGLPLHLPNNRVTWWFMHEIKGLITFTSSFACKLSAWFCHIFFYVNCCGVFDIKSYVTYTLAWNLLHFFLLSISLMRLGGSCHPIWIGFRNLIRSYLITCTFFSTTFIYSKVLLEW